MSGLLSSRDQGLLVNDEKLWRSLNLTENIHTGFNHQLIIIHETLNMISINDTLNKKLISFLCERPLIFFMTLILPDKHK